MSETRRTPIIEWSVDYGDGRDPVHATVPHAWRQDVPVALEGPVIYKTAIDVPRGKSHIHFHGVSYAADVLIEGRSCAIHKGIWDSFDVPVDAFAGKHVNVEVRVVKNGGPTYPVRDVASGFLPFVYHSFGGIYGEVELVEGEPGRTTEPFDASTRFTVRGRHVYVDGSPFYIRGLLSWGWYPEIGHPNPPEEVIREELRKAKSLGFNLVKFCLWVPRHRYLEIMREEGLEAWLELPLWDPTDEPGKQQEITGEIERIVREYRRHDNILVWTVGCELSTSTGAEFRRYLTEFVRNLTNSPLVKDNSGGAEMYGGDLREFGTFHDFHPYCDTQFYPSVLDSLQPGPRGKLPTLLGEFNDIDVHRDLAALGNEMPFWASTLGELNDQGVRWQHDLPEVVSESRFSLHPARERHAQLMESSRLKALFIRKTVQEAVRARDAISGYVVTGWRDTPISSSGFFDDFDQLRFSPDECESWNGSDVLHLIPTRRPPWVKGGNRVGYLDPQNFFPGQLFWRVGLHTERGRTGGLIWRLVDASGELVARGAEAQCTVDPLSSLQVAEISIACSTPGEYRLEVEFGAATNQWPIWVVPQPSPLAGWRVSDPTGLLTGLEGSGDNLITTMPSEVQGTSILFLTGEGTVPCPFWREAAYEFKNDEFWAQVPFRDQWDRLLPISPDCAIDADWSTSRGWGDMEVLMNRIDTRTYKEHPVIARCGDVLVTTLRPFGGLGNQPTSLSRNPAGTELVRTLAMFKL